MEQFECYTSVGSCTCELFWGKGEKLKKIILYGAGDCGKKALNHFGSDRIAFFCDGAKTGNCDGVPIINYPQLIKMHSEYDVIITPVDARARSEIADKLAQAGIPFSIYMRMQGIVHLFGVFPEIWCEYEHGIWEDRIEASMRIFREMFRTFPSTFQGRKIDIWLCADDHAQIAYDASLALSLTHIHAYSSVYSMLNRVIPIPDYSLWIKEGDSHPLSVDPGKCKEASEMPWSDPRAYWRGNLFSSHDRHWLFFLGKAYPDRLFIESSTRGGFVSMPEQAKYKYLIDIRGVGWTDRLKTLLQLGRPVLLVDRPYREWYFDYMEPMVHYVPVKEDLSDLIDRIDCLDAHPEVYDRIVANAKEFCKKYLIGRPVLEYLRDVTLQYDVVERLVERNDPWNPETYRKERLLLD